MPYLCFIHIPDRLIRRYAKKKATPKGVALTYYELWLLGQNNTRFTQHIHSRQSGSEFL